MAILAKHNKSVSTNHALISDAVEVLVRHLGPERTTRLWHVLAPETGDYLSMRAQLFSGKDDETLDRAIRKFNRK